MWFAAMGGAQDEPWFSELVEKLLQGDRGTIGLLDGNPFPNAPPKWIRAQLYQYHFTTPSERRATGRWWNREYIAPYYPPVRLRPE